MMDFKSDLDRTSVEKQNVVEYKDTEHSIDNENAGYISPSPEELKAVIWKLDVRIIPFLGLLYLCSFLDRVNIGNAKLAGITEDLHISSTDYNIALSIFFIGYVNICFRNDYTCNLSKKKNYFNVDHFRSTFKHDHENHRSQQMDSHCHDFLGCCGN